MPKRAPNPAKKVPKKVLPPPREDIQFRLMDFLGGNGSKQNEFGLEFILTHFHRNFMEMGQMCVCVSLANCVLGDKGGQIGQID